ncbi:MAG: hypothetical protein LBG59_01015 [Candidatus Peribacteria bacterium]|jgi:hypothetical protein|nr:hypothetical protein [Candidatus Peribacteria bacterium]
MVTTETSQEEPEAVVVVLGSLLSSETTVFPEFIAGIVPSPTVKESKTPFVGKLKST